MESSCVHLKEPVINKMEEAMDLHAITGKCQNIFLYGTKEFDSYNVDHYAEVIEEIDSNADIRITLYTCFNQQEEKEALYVFQNSTPSKEKELLATVNFDELKLYEKDELSQIRPFTNYVIDTKELGKVAG